jgi:fatty-acyl-CoA synthase
MNRPTRLDGAPMSRLLHFGLSSPLTPICIRTRSERAISDVRDWNERSCKPANALLGLGLEKGDRIAVLAYNCLEWMEIYAAVAKAGLVIVPINFRLVGPEVQYIVENSEAKAVVVQDDLLDLLETIRAEGLIAEDKHIHFGGRTPAGYRSYEDLVAAGANSELGSEKAEKFENAN